jgi:ubiquinone/menaquinone biosynthesis C-methylase UbiE
MSFYRNRVYPHLLTLLGNPKPIQELRRQIVPSVAGTVLEIGVGPGVNFAYYDRSKVKRLYALEPNPGMVARAQEEGRCTGLNVEFLDLPGERIPLPDASVDTVVSTFTLCTIPGVTEAIRGIARVLKPGGQFLFIEHGLSPDMNVRRWQKRTEPLFQWAFEGCHVTRDIPSLIKQGGLRIEQLRNRLSRQVSKVGIILLLGFARPE